MSQELVSMSQTWLLPPGDDTTTPAMTTQRLAAAAALAGTVEGDSAWSGASAATGFHPVRPFGGEPASEGTEARTGFTDDTLYAGVTCSDGTPNKVAVSDSPREGKQLPGDLRHLPRSPRRFRLRYQPGGHRVRGGERWHGRCRARRRVVAGARSYVVVLVLPGWYRPTRLHFRTGRDPATCRHHRRSTRSICRDPC